jgi:hypothetical protein
MDFAQAASRWNRAVSLKNPTASTVVSVLRATPQRVFEAAPEFLYLGNNLQLSLPPASEYGEGVPALSISLILRRNFFAADARVRTEDLPRFAFLGTSVPCSAQAMLEHLTGTDAKNVATSTEQDRWTIYYGKGLSLLFLPASQGASVARQSELAMIEFFYSLPFDGQLSPNVEDVPAASL